MEITHKIEIKVSKLTGILFKVRDCMDMDNWKHLRLSQANPS